MFAGQYFGGVGGIKYDVYVLLCFEQGTIQQGSLTAFNIALEQFHNAVADRKALLMNMPQSLQRSGTALRATGTL